MDVCVKSLEAIERSGMGRTRKREDIRVSDLGMLHESEGTLEQRIAAELYGPSNWVL